MRHFEEMNSQFQAAEVEGISRRGLIGGGATLLLSFALSPVFGKPFLEVANAANSPSSGGVLNGWISITPSNTVEISFGGAEMGQGIMTGLAQAAAEELMVDWSQVTTVLAPAGAKSYVTGGSYGIRGHFDEMRQAGATARQMLLQAAGPGAVATGSGKISVNSTIKTYAELASAASLLTVSTPVSLTSSEKFKIVGKSLGRTDIPSKTNGSAKFGLDTRLPNMVFAAIINSPTLGGYLPKTTALPATPAGCLALVRIPNAQGVVTAVAVVASNTWNAMNASQSLSINWTKPSSAVLSQLTSAAISTRAQTLMTSGTALPPAEVKPAGSNARSIWTNAATGNKVDLQYQLPYLPHITMEVPNCTIKLSADGASAEVWVPTQAPTWVQGTVASVTGASNVIVHPTLLGGGLGRRIDLDYVYQAAQLAALYGKPNNVPIQLMWPREQDLSHDQYRPMSLIRVRMAWDSNKAITAYYTRMVAPSPINQRGWTQSGSPENDNIDGAKDLVYNFGANFVEYVVHDSTVPVGFWRSVGNSMNCFAVESALDEVALATGQDSLTMRKNLLSNPDGSRLLACLNAVERQITSSPLPVGNGRGYAVSN